MFAFTSWGKWFSIVAALSQFGSHEERAEGEGVTDARCKSKPSSETPAGPPCLENTRTGQGDHEEGEEDVPNFIYIQVLNWT